MKAGKMDRRLTILAVATMQDSMGQPKSLWSKIATTYAERLSLRAMDVQRDAGRDHASEHKYRIRWRDDVTADDRVEVDGQHYAITAIEEPDRKRSMILSVMAV